MALGYMGAIEKFEEVINSAQNPQIASLAEGLKLLAQAVRNDLTKIEREVGAVKSDVHTVQNRVNSLRS
jgi:archaellum component FlaC